MGGGSIGRGSRQPSLEGLSVPANQKECSGLPFLYSLAEIPGRAWTSSMSWFPRDLRLAMLHGFWVHLMRWGAWIPVVPWTHFRQKIETVPGYWPADTCLTRAVQYGMASTDYAQNSAFPLLSGVCGLAFSYLSFPTCKVVMTFAFGMRNEWFIRGCVM